MPPCHECRGQLLDHLYGLLDPAAAAAVEAHLAECPACAAYAKKSSGLIAAATKSAFPGVNFQQPTPATVTPATAKPAIAPSRLAWVPLVLAASVLLVAGGWALLAAFDTIGYAARRAEVDRDLRIVELAKKQAEEQQTLVATNARRVKDEEARVVAARAEATRQADDQLASAGKEFKEVQEKWIAAEKAQVQKLSALPFMLDVRGPATMLPGAPNEYTVRISDANGGVVPDPVTVEAVLKDGQGNELLREKFTPNPADGYKLKVPAAAWQKVSAGGDVFLSMTATDKVGAKSELTENLKLLQPVYTTFLTTDKPMYRPGEVVYFRTLTLDRTRFLPPDRDVQVRFEIKAQSGQVLPGSASTGLARAGKIADDGKVETVLGPDGKPLRGIASAAFPLSADLPGGEYTLNVFEVPTRAGETLTADANKPLAVRKFVVNQYTPETLLKKLEWDGKSYGPGDVVQARLEVKDQGKPVKATLGAFSVTADGKPVKLDFPAQPVTTTDDNGIANFKFTLPKDVEEIKQASLGLSVTVGGVTEGFNKPVPLTSRRLTVEFFPEGGDLIAGVQNRVYLRASTSTGKPADISGTLMLGADEVKNVNTVKTLTDPDHPGANQGVGVFTFTPEADQQYTLKLSRPLGLLQPDGGYPLPKAKKEGLLLSVPTGVTQPTEPIKVAVTSAGKKREVLVGAYVRGRAVAHTKLSLEADKPAEAALDLSGTKLGGVTRVTVFELPAGAEAGREDLKPLAERLVYRVPGESLKVSYSAKRTSGAGGAFVPGEKVELAVESRDESERPKPAVLWAAVVNQSVLTMADEKSERSLPTHFLLSGEVKKGEDMEHADFLLTKHPKAAEALDLVLGTQGWRRFAEQAPAEFRKGVPAEDADRILLVSAANAALPTGMRPAMRGVFNEHYPKFETALLNVENAERGKRAAEARAMNGEDLKELSTAQQDLWNAMSGLTTADATRDASVKQFARTSERLKPYDLNWEKRRKVLGMVVAALLGLAVGGIALGLKVFRGTTAGKSLVGCSFGLLAVAAAVSLFGLITGKDNDTWRDTAQKANQEFPDALDDSALTETVVTLDATGAVVVQDVPADGVKFDRDGAIRNKMPAPKAAALEGRRADGKMMEGLGAAAGEVENFNKLADRKDAGKEFLPPVAAPAFGGPVPPPAPPAGPGGPGQRWAEAKNDPAKPGAIRGANPQAGGPPGGGGGRGGFGGGGRPGGFNGGMNGFGGGGFAPGAAFPGGPVAGGMPGAGPGFFPPGDGLFDKRLGGQGGEEFALNRLEVQQQRGLKFNEFLNRRQQDLGTVLAKGDEKAKKQKAQEQIGLFTEFLPQSLPLVVREYAHVRPAVVEGAAREDFTETLLWQPVLVTNTDGKATTSFTLSDAVAPYRVLIAGHSLDGRIGSVSGVIEVRKPFSIDPKLPQEIGSSDKLDVPLVGLNGTDEKRNAEVTVAATGLKVLGGDKVQFPLNGLAGGRTLVRLVPDKLDGELSVQVDGKAGTDTDSITRKLTVVADGFPAGGQKSDVLETKMTAPLELPKQVIPGTLTMKVTVYPNTLSEVQAGLDGLLREPHGCFEQTSTTNYPNVLVLDYLNETNQAKPEVSKRAKELLDRGYGKLTSFECQKPAADGRQGYEWFGGSAPPHESLTAYGLLQFTDMSRVFPVDQEMLKRTKQYLIGSKDGQGGFKKNPRALDTFGYAPAEIANAYIVWAITESERTAADKSDLKAEVEALVKLANGPKAGDPYFVGLVANSLLNRGDRKAGEELLKKLTEKQDKTGKLTGATASVTNSTGQALEIETTAIAVLGWLKANEAGTFRPHVDLACKYIGGQRSGGGDFGSTQSTILALKSLIEYARSNKRPAEDGTITVTVGGAKVGEKKFTSQQSGPIVVDIAEPEKLLKDGKLSVDVSTDGKQPYPCTVSWECRTRTPNSSKDCPLTLATKLNKTDASEGDTVRLGVTVTNLKGTQNGMVTAIVGIPAGLKVPEDMKQLKLLTEKGPDGKRATVSYWEKRGRELVFYWHGMGEKETIEFGVDLIADVPGEYRGPASRVYLYYGAEHKMWAAPVDVKIGGK